MPVFSIEWLVQQNLIFLKKLKSKLPEDLKLLDVFKF
jgi:hypothetical protein